MSEHDGIAKVIEGYRHFSEQVYPEHRELFEQLRNKQAPQILFITCSDSRIDPALITQSSPGDLFVCRNIGNIVPASGEAAGGVDAVLEYSILALKVRHIIVCGHSDCGAMKALKALDAPGLASMPSVKSWLRNAEPAIGMARANHGNPSDDLTLALIRENVRLQLQHLRNHRVVAAAISQKLIALHGWVYDIGDGVVSALDESKGDFKPLADSALA